MNVWLPEPILSKLNLFMCLFELNESLLCAMESLFMPSTTLDDRRQISRVVDITNNIFTAIKQIEVHSSHNVIADVIK